jgi:hypothetical protein
MKISTCIAVLLTLLLSLPALAEWTVSKNPVGPGYRVSDGKQTIHVKKEETARKMAKAINDAEIKEEDTDDDD